MRVVVYHGGYGCDTGCCGHYVDLDDGTPYLKFKFEFDHPADDESREDFVRRMVTQTYGAEHCADIDWDECLVVDD